MGQLKILISKLVEYIGSEKKKIIFYFILTFIAILFVDSTIKDTLLYNNYLRDGYPVGKFTCDMMENEEIWRWYYIEIHPDGIATWDSGFGIWSYSKETKILSILFDDKYKVIDSNLFIPLNNKNEEEQGVSCGRKQ
jgi:hypothetical protein